LFVGLAGDVIAARALARLLLGRLSATITPSGLSQLILTAACLHVQSRMGPEPSLEGVVLLLTELAIDRRGEDVFWTSPMQLVQYVAAELEDVTPAARAAAFDLATRAAAPGPSNAICRRGTSKKARQGP
jgi:hypothetical protein